MYIMNILVHTYAYTPTHPSTPTHTHPPTHTYVRACVACTSLYYPQWEIKAPIPSASFKAITKQMVKLHEALVDILPEDQLAGVFSGIEEVLCRHISQHLSRLGITNNGSTQHGLVVRA